MTSDAIIDFAGLQWRGGNVFRAGSPLALTRTESAVLRCLAEARGAPVGIDTLLDRGWGDADVGINSLNRAISTLRAKLGGRQVIRTHFAQGYSLKVDPPRPRAMLAAANPKALQLFLQAYQTLGTRSGDNFIKAIELVRSAVAIDPEFEPGWNGLGALLLLGTHRGLFEPRTTAAEVDHFTADLLIRNPDAAGTLALRGNFALMVGGDPRGLADVERAAQLVPDNLLIRNHLGSALCASGRSAEGYAAMKSSAAIDTTAPTDHVVEGLLLIHMGRPEVAAAALTASTTLLPEWDHLHMFLSIAESLNGNHVKAHAAAQRAVTLSSGLPVHQSALAYVCAAAGDRQAARAAISEAQAYTGAWLLPSYLAPALLLLDGEAAARDALAEAEVLGCPYRSFARHDPRLAALF